LPCQQFLVLLEFCNHLISTFLSQRKAVSVFRFCSFVLMLLTSDLLQKRISTPHFIFCYLPHFYF
jgi:hypothetical protein